MAVLLPNGIDIDDAPLSLKGRVLLLSSGYDGGLYTQLVAGGCFVNQVKIKEGLLYDQDALTAVTPQEGTTSLVAVGGTGILDCAKVLSARYALPLYLVPTCYAGAATNRWALTMGREIKEWQAQPYEVRMLPAQLAHANRLDAAETYAYALQCYLHGVATVTSNWLEGREEANSGLLAAMTQLDGVLTAVGGYTTEAAKTLWEGILAISRYLPDEIPEGHYLSWLISLYKGGQIIYNKYRFAAAFAVGVALSLAPDTPDLTLPADRVRTAKGMAGMPIPRWKDELMLEHVWQDYRQDVADLLRGLPRYARNWRRMVGNCGYGFYEDLGTEDLVRGLRETCHLTKRYSSLCHLYREGWLDDKGERYGSQANQVVFDGHGRDGISGQTGHPRRV